LTVSIHFFSLSDNLLRHSRQADGSYRVTEPNKYWQIMSFLSFTNAVRRHSIHQVLPLSRCVQHAAITVSLS